MPVDLLAGKTQQEPVDLLAGMPPAEEGLSFRQGQPQSLWERMKSVLPYDALDKAKAQNSLIYSEMFGIRPSQAYDFHDEISSQLQTKMEGEKIVTEKKGFGTAVEEGVKGSIAGMLWNQKAPQPFESVSQAESWINGLVALGVDIPFFAAGYAIGGANPVSGMAGAFGLHSGLRQILIDRYTKGEVRSGGELFERIKSAAKETIKGEIVGAFTGGAKFVAPSMFQKLAPGLETPAAWTAWMEISTMTAAGKMIEGQMPTAKDFVETASLLIAMHAGMRGYEYSRSRISEVRDRLKGIYVDTGAHPKLILDQIASERNIDPKEDIIETIDRVNETLREQYPDPPQPPVKPLPESIKTEGRVESTEAPLIEEAKKYKTAEQPDGTTSIKNAVVDAEREARGLEPIERPVVEKPSDWREQVEIRVDSGEINPQEIARKVVNLVETKEEIPGEYSTSEINHALLYGKKNLERELFDIEESIEKKSSQELLDRRSEIERLLDENELATSAIGTEEGRALQSRQYLMDLDYSLPAMLTRARKDGVTVTPEVRQKYKKLSKEIQKAQRNVEQVTKGNFENTVKRIQSEEAKIRRKEKRQYTIEELDAEFDLLVKDFNKSISGIYSNPMFNPEAYSALIKMTRNRIRKGIVKAEDIIDSIHTALANAGISIDKRDIRDTISQYGVIAEMSKEEINVALREAKRQMRLISALEDAQKGEAPQRSGLQRDPVSDRVRELTKEVKIAMRESGIETTSPEQRWVTAKKQFITRTENLIKEYERRLKEGDFSPRQKRVERELSGEELKLKFQLEELKREYAKEALNDRLRQRGLPTVVKDSVVESMHLVKAIKSAYDISAPGRQGFYFLVSHPITGFRNVPDMIRALRDPKESYRLEERIKNDPFYKDAMKGKLSITDTMERGTNVEEMYKSRWGEYVPGVAASNRAFTTYLNLIRMSLFKTMYKSAFSKRKPTVDELKAIADYANTATGRGTYKGHEQALQGLGTVLWAPKLVLSRFQMLLGKGLMPGGGRTMATRIAVAKEYARILTGLAVIYTVADTLGFEIETDPRSSDFRKIKVGNTRIDILAGVSQSAVFIARLWTGETKSTKSGIITPIYGDFVPYGGDDSFDVMARFFRSKLTPVLGVAINQVTGKNLIGEKVTLYEIPEETVVPLAMLDVYEAMLEEGVPAGMALGMLGMFGIGIQTHEENRARR